MAYDCFFLQQVLGRVPSGLMKNLGEDGNTSFYLVFSLCQQIETITKKHFFGHRNDSKFNDYIDYIAQTDGLFVKYSFEVDSVWKRRMDLCPQILQIQNIFYGTSNNKLKSDYK